MATTIINPTPSATASDSNGIGFLLGVIALAVFTFLFFVYGLPLIQGLSQNGVQVNVPKNIDVNVNQSK